MKTFCLIVVAVFVCCGVSPSSVHATVFRDRASFNAASQNLHLIDFESAQMFDGVPLQIDGVLFRPFNGADLRMGPNGTRTLFVPTVGEITRLIIDLPPGTTAVGCDQFATPMIVTISTGSTSESVTMNPGDSSTFAGFVSAPDQPIKTLTIELDFPEPTPSAVIDNVSFGQRREGNEPPLPFLLVTNNTGRAAALDSVTTLSEPFRVTSIHNMSSDGRTRLTLFVVGLVLAPSDLPDVRVQAENAQLQVFDLPVESADRVKNVRWMSQVIVRLPDSVAGAGNLQISVTVRGVTSNKAPLRID